MRVTKIEMIRWLSTERLRVRWLLVIIVPVCLSVGALAYTNCADVLEPKLRGVWESLFSLKMASDLTLSLAEVGEHLRRVDWLFWILLYLPFNFFYVTNKEELCKLRKDADFYKEDNAVKRKFIKWQGKVNLELQEAIAELRLERRSLKSLLESLRKQMEKKQEAPESFVKKNKSDSAIAEMVEVRDEKPEEKPRPKTQEGRPTSIPCVQYQQTCGRKRKEHLKKAPPDRHSYGDIEPSISPESSSEDNSVPKLKPPSRSKYTLRKELEEYTLPSSRLKTRAKEKKTEELTKPSRQKSSHMPLSLQNGFRATEELVATLDVRGRAASYTEVYKKKVHMPSSGKPPEITVEVSACFF